MEDDESKSFEYTSTWVVSVVCTVIILLSIVAERGLHSLGKVCSYFPLTLIHNTCLMLWYYLLCFCQLLKRHNQDALFEALQKLKEGQTYCDLLSCSFRMWYRIISNLVFFLPFVCFVRVDDIGIHFTSSNCYTKGHKQNMHSWRLCFNNATMQRSRWKTQYWNTGTCAFTSPFGIWVSWIIRTLCS